jgi:polysaccharide pyruvyl transferase WcaK-like protein
MMMHAFWRALPSDILLEVGVFDLYEQQHESYPPRHNYHRVGHEPIECRSFSGLPGLLCGATLITDLEGGAWPLGFLSPRVRHFLDQGLPVDALGIGADHLITAEGRRLFRENFLGIRSWTVRDNSARDSLLELGVEEACIAVGADWAWLYQSGQDDSDWSAALWSSLGVDAASPLLVVNVFHQHNTPEPPAWLHLAAAFDQLNARHGFEVAFFCNECRHPGFDRTAAERLRSLMRRPSVLVPNEYYSPAEAVALLRHASATLGQRYHFCIESVFAGVCPVNMRRGQKLEGLCRELGLAPCASIQQVDRDEVVGRVLEAAGQRPVFASAMAAPRRELEMRAWENFKFVRRSYEAQWEAARTPAT